MKRLMTVNEAKEVSRDCSVWRSILSDYASRDKALSYVTLRVCVLFFIQFRIFNNIHIYFVILRSKTLSNQTRKNYCFNHIHILYCMKMTIQ